MKTHSMRTIAIIPNWTNFPHHSRLAVGAATGRIPVLFAFLSPPSGSRSSAFLRRSPTLSPFNALILMLNTLQPVKHKSIAEETETLMTSKTLVLSPGAILACNFDLRMLSKRPTMPAIPFLLPLPPTVTISSHCRQKEFHDHGSISTLHPRKLGKSQEEQNSHESEDDFETIPTHKKTSL